MTALSRITATLLLAGALALAAVETALSQSPSSGAWTAAYASPHGTTRNPVQPTSHEVVIDGPGMVVGERGPVPVPPGRIPWGQRMGAPRVARPRIVRYAADEVQSEELPLGQAQPSLQPTPAHGSVMMHPGEGEVIFEGPMPPGMHPGMMHVDGDCASCGVGGDCGRCRTWSPCDDDDCCLLPCPSGKNFMVFGGVHGFTNPGNAGYQGSFGFHEGINWGLPLRFGQRDTPISGQVGVAGVHSNFSGSHPDLTSSTRNQTFVTFGLFRRVDCGLQFGAVVDYMSDNYWYTIELGQVRAEVSWVFPCFHEVGFHFTHALGQDSYEYIDPTQTAPIPELTTWRATNLYKFFYRYRYDDCGSYMRMFGGFTNHRDGLFGGDLFTPINEFWAFQADFVYLLPSQGSQEYDNLGGGVENEAWNVSFSFVWFPRGTAKRFNYDRPLFDVANNGSFILNRLE